MKGRGPGRLALLLLLVVLAAGPVYGQEQNPKALARILAGMEERWETLPGLSARMTHTWEWVLAGETQMTKGSVYLAGGNRFRIETDDLTLVSDGTTIWQYSPGQKQVIIDRVDPRRPNASPEQLFVAFTRNAEAEWVREERQGKARLAVIRLNRDETADPRMVEAWIDEERFLVVKLSYTDGAGNRHRYELDRIEVEAQPEERFRFTIPEGVVVVDMRRPGGGL